MEPKGEKFRAWISKYALTKGVYEVEVTHSGISEMVSGPGTFEHYHGEGRDWHRTREEAATKANTMRVAKIASLKKQIEKLERLRFS